MTFVIVLLLFWHVYLLLVIQLFLLVIPPLLTFILLFFMTLLVRFLVIVWFPVIMSVNFVTLFLKILTMNPFVNQSKMDFSDVSFFMDERLKDVNVLLFRFAFPVDSFPIDFVTFVKSWTFVCILQECSDDSCKFTIVTHVSPSNFQRHVDSILDRLRGMYQCSKLQLCQL